MAVGCGQRLSARGCPQGSRQALLRGLIQARMLAFKGRRSRRRARPCAQCRLSLSRSPLPRLRHAPDRCARYLFGGSALKSKTLRKCFLAIDIVHGFACFETCKCFSEVAGRITPTGCSEEKIL